MDTFPPRSIYISTWIVLAMAIILRICLYSAAGIHKLQSVSAFASNFASSDFITSVTLADRESFKSKSRDFPLARASNSLDYRFFHRSVSKCIADLAATIADNLKDVSLPQTVS